MANPFQQGGTGNSFFDNDYNPTGLPAPIGQRRSSYASVVSGATALSATRGSRAGGFSHLLNPSPEDMFSGSNMYSPASGLYDVTRAPHSRTDTPGDEPAHWPPRAASSLPLFSRAFDMFTSRDPLFLAADEFTHAPLAAGHFLAPSYLKGSVYLQKLEEAHKAKLLAQRDGQIQAAQSSSSLPSNGSSLSLHTKLPQGSHRGVSFELIEKSVPLLSDDDDAAVSPLPSRWNKDDKNANLEVLGDGYEVKYTGHRSSGDRDHEACAIRADHPMPPQSGVYYFEVMILSRKREE